MAELFKGSPVAAAINEKTAADLKVLKENGAFPVLAILQVGQKDENLAYANSAKKRCAAIGIAVKDVTLPNAVTQDELLRSVRILNEDETVHGVLILRPLPEHINDDAVRRALKPEKDVDGITDVSLGGVFTGNNLGYAPCTAQACMEILKYYNVDLKGKNVCVIGHSLVVGRPTALMALCKDATVTVCHINTLDTAAHARETDIVIVAVGKAGLVDKNYLSPGQIVIDVGINVNENGKLCGDLNAEDADPIVSAYSPVPGGVGSVTTAVLISHVIEAAKKAHHFE